jgi:P4 family phage/plasmid primase-like protien
MPGEKLTTPGLQAHDTHPITMADPYFGSALQEFLEPRRLHTGRGHVVSMTGMGAHKGNWFVADDDYEQFLDILHDYLFVSKLRPNNFVEQRKQEGLTPLLIDLDFKYPSEKNLLRTFTNEHIQSFIVEIVTILKEFFELRDRQQIRFFVTLRSQPYQDSKANAIGKKDIKDGVHIVCPDFRVTSEMYGLIRHLLLERASLAKSFEGTGYTNTDDNVIDKHLMNKIGWFFYGESKPSIPPYLLTDVFKYTPRTGKMIREGPEGYDSRTLIKLLSIRFNSTSALVVVEKQRQVFDDLLASMKLRGGAAAAAGGGGAHEQFPANQMVPGEATGMLPIIMDSFNTIVSTEDEVELAKRLAIECLSGDRADSYDTWMRVGWCLRNIEASDEMFDIWMKFSEKSGKSGGNNVEQLRREWMRGTMRRLNGTPSIRIGSLKMWAREDNQVRFKEIMDGDIISYITKTGLTFKGGTHHHVAMMIHKLFYDVYKCTVEGRTTEWYEFKNHTWNPMPQGLLIKTMITEEIAKKVDSARCSLRPPEANLPADEYQEKHKQYNESVVKLLKLQENLYNANFKDSVMKEAVQLFYDPDFYKRINQNPYFLGCANGILNLREPIFDEAGHPVRYKPTLHPGTANDYVTLKAGVTADGKEPIEYMPYDPDDPKQQEIMDFFRKLFPADDLREYVLTLAAGCLEGANKEQCFYIMTGSGGNGKSKFVELMISVLGQYAGSLASTALTRKRPESGAANPDIMSIKGCRFIETKEPDEGEPLNSARMKQFSGEDLVEARGLFKDQERFKITGKIFLACNRMPPIHSMDGGTWRRIRVIPFDSRFLPVGDPMIDSARHIYPRDDMLDERIKSWRVPFLSLLVHYYETKYCPHGIKHTPAVVLQASENYKGNFDSFGKFIKSRVRRVPGYDMPPQFKDFWKAYRNWFNDQSATGKKLTENELRIRLNELYQAPADGKTYLHLQLFDMDEDTEQFDRALAEEREAAAAAGGGGGGA